MPALSRADEVCDEANDRAASEISGGAADPRSFLPTAPKPKEKGSATPRSAPGRRDDSLMNRQLAAD